METWAGERGNHDNIGVSFEDRQRGQDRSEFSMLCSLVELH